MKTSKIFSLIAGLIILAAAIPAGGITDEENARLDEIELYIDSQKQAAENYYTALLSEAEYKRQSLLLPLQNVYIQQDIHCSGFFSRVMYLQEVLKGYGTDLKNDRDFARTLKTYRGTGVLIRDRLDQPPKLLAIAEKHVSEQINRIERRFFFEAEQIEKQKRYALNVRLPELEDKLKDNVLNSPKQKSGETIKGVVYSEDKQAAVIGSRIVRPGDEMGKIRIVSISLDGVEFEKDGRRWKQKIGE